MTTYNTGNPIGSTDSRDRLDNSENFDKAINSTELVWNDRLGVTRDTFEGALSKLSFYRVGTFAAGYTLTNMRQTLEYNGHEYSWAGAFPKVVAAGATPETSGGISSGAWVDQSGVAIRSDLAAVTGASLVNTSTGETVEDRLSDIDSSLSGKADLAGSASQTFSVADATDPHHAVSYGQYLTAPTDTVAGIVRRATNAEEVAGTSDVGFLTPLGLRNAINASGAAPIFAPRAWVNFKGTETVAIKASGNVSSITDNGTGDYTINFTTALPDVNYSSSLTVANTSVSSARIVAIKTTSSEGDPTLKTVSALRIISGNPSTLYDLAHLDCIIFR